MNRLLTKSIAVASLLFASVGAPSAFAHDGGAHGRDNNANTSNSAEAGDGKSMRHHRHRGHRGMQELRNASPEERAVVRSIMKLERVYLSQGRVNDIKPLLLNVKRKTSNEMINKFVDRQLERMANRPAKTDQQIATMTQQLNDDIGKLQ